MQPQINAIKQLLEINNITASQIEEILVKALGQRASWQNSIMGELASFEDRYCDDQEEIDPQIRWILELLWRSRIDLNDARINAEEVDLEGFLANYKKPIFSDFSGCEESVKIASTIRIPRLHEIMAARDRELDSLKNQLESANSEIGRLHLQNYPVAERDREIQYLKEQRTELESERSYYRQILDELCDRLNLHGANAFEELKNYVVTDLSKDFAERDRRVAGTFEKMQRDHAHEISGIFQDRYEFLKSLKDVLGLDGETVKETDILEAIAKLKTDYITMVEDGKKDDGDRDKRLALLDNTVLGLSDSGDYSILFYSNDGFANYSCVQELINAAKGMIKDRDRQIEELQISPKNHGEQFDDLKSHFEVILKAIAMNLNALKGARKPDETKEVNGVMTTFRNYDDNLTHHHKTIIIENVQRAIAEEVKKLKGINLKDFSFDDIPF